MMFRKKKPTQNTIPVDNRILLVEEGKIFETPEELAAYLGVSSSIIKDAAQLGKLLYKKHACYVRDLPTNPNLLYGIQKLIRRINELETEVAELKAQQKESIPTYRVIIQDERR